MQEVTPMRDEETTAYALAASRGDAEAVIAFVRATQADVWRYVVYLAGRGPADDLTQETYLRALRGLRSFRGDTAARVWLLSIARRAVVDHFRRESRRPRIAESLAIAPGSDAVGTVVPDAAGVIVLQALVDRLDPDKRSAFVLTQVSGLSYADAAEVCDVPVGTIRSRVARARDDLVTWLTDAESDAAVDEATRTQRTQRRLR
jgi:RNA polymerase sigma-70 factor, ECF subfamily